MATAPQPASVQNLAAYQSVVQDAAAGGSLLMGKLVAAARVALQAREAASRDFRERDAFMQSAKQLRDWEPELCQRYPAALRDAFANPALTQKARTLSIDAVHFDELELMDEVQVLTSVALARTQQLAMMAAEVSLAELNTLVCGMQGLATVQAERNPLRPQIYINALQKVVEQTQLPAAMQLDWLGAMSPTLGQELQDLYVRLCAQLQDQGVAAVGYAVKQVARGPGIGRGIAQEWGSVPASRVAQPSVPPRRVDATLLTLDKLRRLLSGELDGVRDLSPVESFAQRFEREFEFDAPAVEAPATNFDATVPAALEALQEMQQVDQVVQRLEQRRDAGAIPLHSAHASVEAVRATLRSHAQSLAQALSLEVVTFMVDNMAQDGRLLEPVQQWIRQMEPALSRLALVDPRLFTNKLHPARVLVQEVVHRSMAYATVNTTGFSGFLSDVQQAVAPLNQIPIESAEPFELILKNLQNGWEQAARVSARNREEAVKALEHAEQRNVLAEKIAHQIEAHPDASKVPAVVIEFLCGPWAQVVAHARIVGGAGSGAADKYQALISALLWSTHPELTRQNTAKLTRLVPLLLGTLRDGLETIRYPATKTSAFLEALMGLHQQAFRANQKPAQATEPPPAMAVTNVARTRLVEEGNPWLAPEEAHMSNFMDMSDTPADPLPQETIAEAQEPNAVLAITDLPLGTWVELMVGDQWVRTQLTWASPHGTLFLFTSVLGATQSMTRRLRDKLVASGNLRIISGQPLVDGALDAVAQQAMRNSVDIASNP